VLIRPRRDDDLAACADLVREVHAVDRYPRYLPDDIASFLAPPDPYDCWVADRDGEVLGHAALVPRGLPATLEVAADILGRPKDQLAVVARLLVSPRARGQGVGRMLLTQATAAAAARGLRPVLDVDKDLAAAIALYESQGWTRAGEVTVRWSDGRMLAEYVYLGPGPESADGEDD
jgi:ribosomal protein S18 acetylase RimI-like enzyme